MMQKTLTGITILDLSRLLPGPYCSMILADLGANVIKIESHLLGDPTRMVPPHVGAQSCYFLSVNRNKKSIALNLRRAAGRQVFLEMAREADVIIEGFRPGRAKRLGIGYEDVQALKPDIVYCSLSGYGQDGPLRDRPGHDINYAALAGLLDLLSLPGKEGVLPGVQLADMAGALFAAIGILAALGARDRRGEGAYVDASMFDGALSLATFAAAPLMGEEPLSDPRLEYLTGSFPCYNVYRTKDERRMTLGALEPVLWSDFCEAIGRRDLVPKQFPHESEREAVISELQHVFVERTRAEWIEFLSDKNLACEPVNTIEEALSSPQVRERGMLWEMDHPTAGRLKQIGLPLRSVLSTSEGLRSSPDEPRTAALPPLLGQHTVEILQGLGYDDQAIEELRARKVVSTPDDVSRRGTKTLESLGSG